MAFYTIVTACLLHSTSDLYFPGFHFGAASVNVNV